MLKKHSILSALILLATMSMPMQAAQQFETYEQAKKQVTDTGYIVFIYPEGWDKYGEKLCRKLIADPAVQKAAGDAALLLAPIYQNRNEETNAHAKKIMGDLAGHGDMADISYPAISFYEKGGRMYASLHGRDLMRASTEQVAKQIATKLAAKKKQDKILAESHNAQKAEDKARLLWESGRVGSISQPGGLREALQNVDPEDKYGYRAALNFGFGIQQGESLDALTKRLDAALENDRLEVWQKQRACATFIGHVRRSLGSMAGGPLITKYARIMHKLDPDSPLGISGPVVMRDWVQQYRYGQGWSEQIIPSAPIPMVMHDVPITKPGTYTVTFKLTTGRDGIRIKRLRLMDGNRCIVSEDSPKDVTWGNTVQTYTLTVKKALKTPTLEITYGNEPDKRSSWGEITVKQN